MPAAAVALSQSPVYIRCETLRLDLIFSSGIAKGFVNFPNPDLASKALAASTFDSISRKINMFSYSTPSRSSTLSSIDSLDSCSARIVDVQALDARFVNPDKLRPRLDEIFHGQHYVLELQRGQWRILGAPKLSKQDKSSLRL